METDTNINDKEYDYLPQGISGLGGWLILVQLGIYITIIMLLVNLFQYNIPAFNEETWNTLTSVDSTYYHPLWKPLIIFEALYNAFFLVFCFYILFSFYGKKQILPRLMIIFYSASVLVGIIDWILLYQIPLARELEDGSSMRDLLKSVFTCLIWVPYFVKSVRVKNTFIK